MQHSAVQVFPGVSGVRIVVHIRVHCVHTRVIAGTSGLLHRRSRVSTAANGTWTSIHCVLVRTNNDLYIMITIHYLMAVYMCLSPSPGACLTVVYATRKLY
jgi:hypothetical protein